MIFIKKLFTLLCLFFLFNTLEVDSNSEKYLIYDNTNKYIEDDFNVYFDKVKSNELFDILEKLNIKVLSYNINGKKYYARNKDDLYNQFLNDISFENRIFYEDNDYYIDSVHILCEVYKLDELNDYLSIY